MILSSTAISTLLIVFGSFWMLIAAIGVVRLPDVFSRLHASTKASSLGLGLILSGVALHFQDSAVTIKVLCAIFFIFLTNPIGAHLIARATKRSGVA